MIETSFFELRCKDVVNIVDGSSLGHITDIVLEICSGKVLGFIVPGNSSPFNIFHHSEDIFIPYQNICKIGSDVILVELMLTQVKNFKTNQFSEVSTLSTNSNSVVKAKTINKDANCENENLKPNNLN